jgi:hypothetical protein
MWCFLTPERFRRLFDGHTSPRVILELCEDQNYIRIWFAESGVKNKILQMLNEMHATECKQKKREHT